MHIDDAEMEEAQDDAKLQKLISYTHQELGASPIDAFVDTLVTRQTLLPAFDSQMPQILEKRKNEDDGKSTAKAKAKPNPRYQEGGASSSGINVIADAPQPKAKGRPKKSQPASSSTSTPPAAPTAPEATHEPKGKAGRPKKSQPASVPQPDVKPPKKTIQKEHSVKSERPVHDTEKVVLDSFNEWNAKGRGFLIDQLHKRKVTLTKTEQKRMSKKELIEKLLKHDGKI
jgi:hypothetical protein